MSTVARQVITSWIGRVRFCQPHYNGRLFNPLQIVLTLMSTGSAKNGSIFALLTLRPLPTATLERVSPPNMRRTGDSCVQEAFICLLIICPQTLIFMCRVIADAFFLLPATTSRQPSAVDERSSSVDTEGPLATDAGGASLSSEEF